MNWRIGEFVFWCHEQFKTRYVEKVVKPSDEFDDSVPMAKFNTSQYYLERSVRAFGEMRRLFFRQIRTY